MHIFIRTLNPSDPKNARAIVLSRVPCVNEFIMLGGEEYKVLKVIHFPKSRQELHAHVLVNKVDLVYPH